MAFSKFSIEALFKSFYIYYSLHKSVQFNYKYSLQREAFTSAVEHLKRGRMILFLNIFKEGGQNTEWRGV